jgi:hypothetical protein
MPMARKLWRSNTTVWFRSQIPSKFSPKKREYCVFTATLKQRKVLNFICGDLWKCFHNFHVLLASELLGTLIKSMF